ncbi:MAG: histidine phosphatase family protein [Bacteroidales bacterium]|nr:histidine phosphatase family protein [Bacteroidales bacterium]
MNKEKILFIARHAKAEQAHDGINDFDRKLLPEGIQRTEKIAHKLLSLNMRPDLIVSSPSVRTLETAKIFAKFFALSENEIVTHQTLYDGTTNDYFDAIYALPDNFSKVMIVGHNPMVSELASFFNKKIEPLPTSGVVVLESQSSFWFEFVIKFVRVRKVLFPKKL